MKVRRFEPGETIVEENDLGEVAYIIQEGSVEITKRTGDDETRLALLGPGDTIGEMSMIDDKPRSASAVAVERTEVAELHRDDFYEALQTDPDVTLLMLRSLFERLREADAEILRLRGEAAGSAEPAAASAPPPSIVLEGLTSEATASLPESSVRISKYPYRVGRTAHNPLVHNDLQLQDESPWQISRHHLAFVFQDGRIGVVDRGSTLGFEIDGKRLGGPGGSPGPFFLEGPESTLLLGSKESPYRYRLTIG